MKLPDRVSNLNWLAAALIGLLFGNPGLSAADSERPNLLLFVVDDMGWMDSTVYGSQYYETPNMERLASQGMIFWNAYSAHPLCSPTRASLMTGQYPARHGITTAAGHTPPDPPDAPPYPEKASPNSQTIQPRTNRYLDPKLVTLAEVLRDADYRTAHIGKWHLGLRPEHWPEAQGFETVFHGAPDPGPPSYHSPYGFREGTVTDGPEGEYITDRITDEAVKFIEAHQNESWYLNLWQYGVHGPWGHKEEYTAQFAKKTDPRGVQKNPIMASMLKSVDESLGRVLDTLDRLKLADKTLVILTSDNGGNVHSNIESDTKTAGIKPGHPRWPMVESWRKWAGFEPPTNNAPLREGKS
ncbi:MAG: sulfatase-like hydrolase/transferase, partial [Verrucomicrobiae bacterium]|nr:sulfatase-like hydrolase/transferase [Verrucomicrobiae bacterium]